MTFPFDLLLNKFFSKLDFTLLGLEGLPFHDQPVRFRLPENLGLVQDLTFGQISG